MQTMGPGSKIRILACILTGVLSRIPCASGENVLGNSGFEYGSGPAGFAYGWGAGPEQYAVYQKEDPAAAHSGDDFLEMTPGPDGYTVCWNSPDIPVLPGASYTAGAYIADSVGGGAGNNLPGMAAAKLEWYANRGDPYESRIDTDVLNFAVDKSGEWSRYSGQAMNDSNAAYLRVVLCAVRVSGQSRTFKFDDCFFGRTNPPARPDINGDMAVNFADYAQIAAAGRDMDGDGVLGSSDLGVFAQEWLRQIAEYPGYELVWSDEFDGIELNGENWTHAVGDSWYNNELQSYTARPENSYVSNGNFIIVGRAESYHGNDYTSAEITSTAKRDFLYGRIEARIKLPRGQGMWPAFWLMPTESVYGGWPHSGEIDIMEAINQMDWTSGAIHFSDANGNHLSSGQMQTDGVTDYSQDYHIYSVDWRPGSIRWLVDGQTFYYETDWSSLTNPYPAPFDRHFYIILNLAIGGNWPGPPDQTTVFPQQMYIDWVRLYSRTSP